jgi:hypothetical protein
MNGELFGLGFAIGVIIISIIGSIIIVRGA